jgi:hypothetical protein
MKSFRDTTNGQAVYLEDIIKSGGYKYRYDTDALERIDYIANSLVQIVDVLVAKKLVTEDEILGALGVAHYVAVVE